MGKLNTIVKSKVVLKKTDILLAIILFIPILIAQISGYLLYELNLHTPLGKLYNLLVLSILIIFPFLKKNKSDNKSNLVLLLLILISYIIYYITTSFNSVIRDTQFIVELFLFPFSYFFFKKHYYSEKKISIEKFQKINRFLLLIIGFFILLSLFGFGSSSYGETKAGESIGYSGYFNAVNEINSIILLLLPFSIFTYGVNHIKIRWGYFIFGLIIALLIGSKTLLLGFTLICFFTFILNIIYFKKVKSVIKTLITIGPIVVISIITIVLLLSDKLMPVFNRMIYKFHSKNDFLSFITSSRVDRITPISDWFFNNTSFNDLIFGKGYTEYTSKNISLLKYGLIEMDMFDVFFISGALGVFIIFYIWYKLIKHNIYLLLNRFHPMMIGFFTISILLFITSLIAGHIMYSSLAGIYMGFSLAYPNSFKKTV